jgi:hypothetical protein
MRWVLVSLVLFLPRAYGGEVHPVDLKPFLGKTQFDHIGAGWLVPKGRQVINGVPFQVDGVVELSGTSARFVSVGRTNVGNIPVNRAGERLHLLLAVSRGGFDDGIAFAKLKLHYAGGEESAVDLKYGHHARDWFGPRHLADKELLDPETRLAWTADHPSAASRDDQIRFFQTSVANPRPQATVHTISLESSGARGGLMLAGLSIGDSKSELADTLQKPAAHDHPTNDAGRTVTLAGQIDGPVSNVLVRVLAVRPPGTNESVAIRDHPAVGKETTSATGRFEVPELPAHLLYRLLIAAPGFEAQVYDGADPLIGPLMVQLRPRGKPSGYFIHGRLVGPDDKPVVGATIQPDGVSTDSSTSWGGSHQFPSLVVSGVDGEFVMGRTQEFTKLSLDIKASGLAPANNVWLPPSNGVQEIRMGVGATIKGRVVKEGQPLADMRIGLVAQDRNSEIFQGNYETKSDSEGRFEFKHVPPSTQWYLYGVMNSFKKHGAVRPTPVGSEGHGGTLTVPDLQVMPGLILAGTVKTRNGEPAPRGARLRVGYDNAWDSQEATVDREGNFRFEGLHAGKVELSLSGSSVINTWRVSSRNRSLEYYSSWQMVGLLEKDKTNFVVEIERGKRDNNSYWQGNGSLPTQDQPGGLPLRGVEPDGSIPIILSGNVIDDETGKPIVNVRVIPGRKPPVATMAKPPQTVLQTLTQPFRKEPGTPWNELPFWYFQRVEHSSNGTFSIEFEQLTSTPMLRIEADGYLSQDTPAVHYSTNMTVRLATGRGLRGIVLQPDGKPAAGANVVLGADREQFSLGKDGALNSYGRKEWLVTTAADGKFSFKPRAGARTVFIGHASGWAEVPAEDLTRERSIELEPWAIMSGRLVRSNGVAVAGERMALQMERDWNLGTPFVNIQERPTTDANGKFVFLRVPPGKLQLHRLVPMGPSGGSGASYQLQTPVYSKPGASNDLGNVIIDSPPPPPALKEFLKKLGL